MTKKSFVKDIFFSVKYWIFEMRFFKGKSSAFKKEGHTQLCESNTQWIGLRENLQENPIFNRKFYGFL
jgi:hypothetical protein